MTVQLVAVLIASAALLLSILGWAYQLGYSNARIVRNERDIDAIQRDMKDRALAFQKREDDLRKDISEGFERLYRKLDELPCHSPKWTKDMCC